MNIGEASAASAIPAKMIRYYEQIGLIPGAKRTPAGYRVYSESDAHTLRFIRCARDLGFSTEQMADLLALWRDRTRAPADVKRIAMEQVGEIERKKRAMRAMAEALRHLAESCQDDHRPDCPVLE